MADKAHDEATRLKRYAIQIAAQLPEDREEALRVLQFARELVDWGMPEPAAKSLHLVRAGVS